MFYYFNTFKKGNDDLTEFSNEPRILISWVILLTILTIGLWIAPLGIVVCLALSVYALRGSRESVDALILLAFLIIFNKGGISLGRWLVLLAAAGRMLVDTFGLNRPVPKVTNGFLLYCISVFVLSFVVSPYPVISLFKIISFTLGVGTVLIQFHRTRHLTNYWISVLFTLGAFILVASLPLYGTGLGYQRNGVGFQGILTHPQTYGPVLAPLTGLFTGLILFRGYRTYLIVGVTLLGWLGMYTSQARTSILATVLGVVIVFATGLIFKSGEWRAEVVRAITRPVTIGIILIVIIFTGTQWSLVQQKISQFLFKDAPSSSIESAMAESRGSLVNKSMQNFFANPMTGIGFGIPSNYNTFEVERGPFGLPISATVEKGFMPAAVLEETGLVGAATLIIFLVMLFTPVIRYGTPIMIWMMISALSVNLGEMVFFSMGGMGFYFWIIMGFCYAGATRELEQASGDVAYNSL